MEYPLPGICLFMHLSAVLIQAINSLSGSSAEGAGGVFSGAALLNENADDYIPPALAAFIAGVFITVICIKLRKRKMQDASWKIQVYGF